jgi:hypothetical protein
VLGRLHRSLKYKEGVEGQRKRDKDARQKDEELREMNGL